MASACGGAGLSHHALGLVEISPRQVAGLAWRRATSSRKRFAAAGRSSARPRSLRMACQPTTARAPAAQDPVTRLATRAPWHRLPATACEPLARSNQAAAPSPARERPDFNLKRSLRVPGSNWERGDQCVNVHPPGIDGTLPLGEKPPPAGLPERTRKPWPAGCRQTPATTIVANGNGDQGTNKTGRAGD